MEKVETVKVFFH